jgi:hypothetical protein
MNQVGSTKDIISQSITGVTDDLGNSVVSTSTDFGSSPLGASARAQALYGIANPNFNLTPPDPDSPIEDQSNPLPFWSIDNGSEGEMTATSVFDDTTQTFGIELNPGTAAIDSTLTLTTRSYLLTDDNLALRQRALSVLSKSGTAAGTTEWNLTLTAIYYDATNTALSTAVIGTALDTGTWTSISGTTTPGGSAISSSAQYVDLSFTMTATAAVTGSAKATIKSLLLQTSTPGGGGSQSFLISETFTSSGDWVRPTGVEYLNAVVLISGGGGGAGGGIIDAVTTSGSVTVAGGGGGGGGFFAVARDLYVGDAGTWAVTVGAGGSGGTARTKVKASGTSVPGASSTTFGGVGSNGGATSFGTYITLAGGIGGSAAGAGGNRNTDGSAFGAGGGAGSVTTNLIFDIGTAVGGAGGQGGRGFSDIGGTVLLPIAGTPGFGGMSQTLKVFPYLELPGAGNAGSAAIGTVSASGTALAGTAGSGGVSGIGGGGGGGGGVYSSSVAQIARGSGAGGSGGGGGGGAGLTFNSGSSSGVTLSGTAGDGGDAGSAGGGGGGAGGGISARYSNNYSTFTLDYQTGEGGNGGGGFVIIVYVG